MKKKKKKIIKKKKKKKKKKKVNANRLSIILLYQRYSIVVFSKVK